MYGRTQSHIFVVILQLMIPWLTSSLPVPNSGEVQSIAAARDRQPTTENLHQAKKEPSSDTVKIPEMEDSGNDFQVDPGKDVPIKRRNAWRGLGVLKTRHWLYWKELAAHAMNDKRRYKKKPFKYHFTLLPWGDERRRFGKGMPKIKVWKKVPRVRFYKYARSRGRKGAILRVPFHQKTIDLTSVFR